MNTSQPSHKDVSARDALHAINDVVHQMAMKLIVLELALREAISTMPSDQRRQFSTKFKRRAAVAMQNSANKLMPIDDAEISRAVAQILDASQQ